MFNNIDDDDDPRIKCLDCDEKFIDGIKRCMGCEEWICDACALGHIRVDENDNPY